MWGARRPGALRTDETSFVDRLRSLARLGEPDVVRQELEGIRAEDLAEALTRLDIEDGLSIMRQIDELTAAEVLNDLPTETARAYINELPDETLAHYLDILPMDDALELREELPEDRFEALLQVIPKDDALEIRRLLSYPEGSAGQILTEDFVEVGPGESVEQVFRKIREAPPEEYEMVNYIYVLDTRRHLLGVLSLKRLIRSDPRAKVEDIMREDALSIPAEVSQEDAARQVARYGLSAMPVLDHRGRMVGIITADDAQEILQEAETEDVLKLGGVGGDAEAYLSLGTFQLLKRRLPWLLILFIAQFLTGAVLRFYTGEAHAEETLLAQLVLFIPLLIGAGGNAGSQVTTTITRALAVGEVRTGDALAILRREFAVAMTMGLLLGLVGFAQAMYGWRSGSLVSVAVGLALPAIIVWATAVGSVLPLGAKRFGLDPAVMSAPFISTFVDATGLIIYFEIARQIVRF
jgi:magnesium transporter